MNFFLFKGLQKTKLCSPKTHATKLKTYLSSSSSSLALFGEKSGTRKTQCHHKSIEESHIIEKNRTKLTSLNSSMQKSSKKRPKADESDEQDQSKSIYNLFFKKIKIEYQVDVSKVNKNIKDTPTVVTLASTSSDLNCPGLTQTAKTVSVAETKPSTSRMSGDAQSSSSTIKSLNINMKAMKTLLILLVGFYVCWLPLIIYFLAFASKTYDNLTIYILMFVACCNAVIDPLVYAFRNHEFCKALFQNFCPNSK